MPSFSLIPPATPIEFQKAMIFIDGTNLFHRLQGAKLQLTQNLAEILSEYTSKRQVVRVYLYTIEEHFKKHKAIHGDCISTGIRVVYGEGVPTKDGNLKEKGVDALLVADLVYHAAVKNFDYALVVTTDTDFVQALRRVEDFGCRTGALSVLPTYPIDCAVRVMSHKFWKNKQCWPMGGRRFSLAKGRHSCNPVPPVCFCDTQLRPFIAGSSVLAQHLKALARKLSLGHSRCSPTGRYLHASWIVWCHSKNLFG